MKADVSRLTFDPAKHYAGVVAQQGRVQLDADWNERDAIAAYLARTQAVDVIGRTGVPKEGGGFAVAVTADGRDLELSPGRLYVDGLLCESTPATVGVSGGGVVATWRVDGRDLAEGDRVDVTVPGGAPVATRLARADATTRTVAFDPPVPGLADGSTLRRRTTVARQPDLDARRPDQTGRYAVYLDVWERLLTTLDDPSIAEPALGQAADTTGRVKVVWQARLARIGDLGQGDCGSPWPAPSSGTLEVRLDPQAGDDGPCVLPPESGYTGLEHQLYRVEVHEPGTFVWQRDNASVVALLEDLGTDVVVSDMGRDEHLGFRVGDLVEATDDAIELSGRAGSLATVVDADRPARVLTLDAAPSVDATRNPKLRRWDGRGDIVVGEWVTLEHGVQVRFGAGDLRTGDHWLVPARAATATDTGDVQWPRADDGTALPLTPHGVRHHYAALALVDFDGSVFRPAVVDCRVPFPPLTAITAADVSYDGEQCSLGGATTVQEALEALCAREETCTVFVSPGPRWYLPLLELKEGQDAEICFPVGEFAVDRTVTLRGLGDLVVSGSGPGTRLVVREDESVLAFEGCGSVTVRDLTAAGGTAPDKRSAAGLNGALSFRGCRDVVVDSVVASCAHRASRAATCVTVGAGDSGSPVRSVRVVNSRLEVGQFQTGLLVWDARRVRIEDNDVEARPSLRDDLVPLRRNLVLHDAIRRMVLPRIASVAEEEPAARPVRATRASRAAAADAPPEFRLASGERMTVTPPAEVAGVWRTMLEGRDMSRFATPAALRTEVRRLATRFARGELAEEGSEGARFLASLQRRMPAVAMQGIVVGGKVAEDVRIADNAVTGVLQGIHVGVSDTGSGTTAPLSAGRVTVVRNTVGVVLPPVAVRGRHGVFVGNCDSLLVDDNRMDAARPRADKRGVEGIRVHGVLGRMALVRANHLSGFTTGIAFTPLGPPRKQRDQWVVEDNLAESASPVVAVPQEAVPRVRMSGNVG